jgi:NAD+ kinase
MKVAIHGKIFSEDTLPLIEQIIENLEDHGAEVHFSDGFIKTALDGGIWNRDHHHYYDGKISMDEFDFLISFGGDGTLLESVTHVGKSETPILGINTGRLGFLASTILDDVGDTVKALIDRDYQIESRILVKVECDTDLFEEHNFGLNEFTVLKQDTSSMITVHTWLNGEYLNSYWADGLIVATPTGSTGYSLSCGGPVVVPQSKNFIITPVSPHNLNVRPLVVSDDSVLDLEVESRSKYYLVSLDSRSKIVDSSLKLCIKREQFCANLIKFDGHSFVNTLRKKLNWGLDARN